MFGLPVQSFNHKGKDKVASGPGTIMTMLILIIALVYAISKAHHIQTVNGQTVTSFEEENEYRSQDHPLNLNARNFRLAFNYRQIVPYTLYSLDDPRYIRRVIRTKTWNADTQTFKEKIIPFHDCTDEDYAQFYPIRKEEKEIFDGMRNDPDRGAICIDWDDADPLQLFGSEGSTA